MDNKIALFFSGLEGGGYLAKVLLIKTNRKKAWWGVGTYKGRLDSNSAKGNLVMDLRYTIHK